MVLPDKYIEAGSMGEQYEEAGLSQRFIEATALRLLGKPVSMGSSSLADEEPTIA